MGRVLQLASFSLAEVTYTAGDISYQVQESVRKASYTVKARQENVSGVILPAFEGVRSKDGSGESSRIALSSQERAVTSSWSVGACADDDRLQPDRSVPRWAANSEE